MRGGRLDVNQDEPLPGVRGLRDWLVQVSTTSPDFGPMEREPSTIEMETSEGRRFSGKAFLTNSSMTESGSAQLWRGTGPLDGLREGEP